MSELLRCSRLTQFKPFEVMLHPERETIRVAPVGELDLAAVPELRERLIELSEAGFRSMTLDLRGLTFIDSAGVHLIVAWTVYAREQKITSELIPGPAVVQRLFELAGVLDRLPFRATSAETRSRLPPTQSTRAPQPAPTRRRDGGMSANAAIRQPRREGSYVHRQPA